MKQERLTVKNFIVVKKIEVPQKDIINLGDGRGPLPVSVFAEWFQDKKSNGGTLVGHCQYIPPEHTQRPISNATLWKSRLIYLELAP